MRIVRRRASPLAPRVLWQRLAEPRGWPELLASPERPPLRRVKLLDAPAPAAGALLHALYADMRWETLRLAQWRPERCLAFVPERTGVGTGDGTPVRTPRRERLILIPQGKGAEAEWTVELDGLPGALARLGPTGAAWEAALEARLDRLCGPGPPSPARANP